MEDSLENLLKNKGYIIPCWEGFKGQADPLSEFYAHTFWNINYSYKWTKSSNGKTIVTFDSYLT